MGTFKNFSHYSNIQRGAWGVCFCERYNNLCSAHLSGKGATKCWGFREKLEGLSDLCTLSTAASLAWGLLEGGVLPYRTLCVWYLKWCLAHLGCSTAVYGMNEWMVPPRSPSPTIRGCVGHLGNVRIILISHNKVRCDWCIRHFIRALLELIH